MRGEPELRFYVNRVAVVCRNTVGKSQASKGTRSFAILEMFSCANYELFLSKLGTKIVWGPALRQAVVIIVR
jgi:hypothetical protein